MNRSFRPSADSLSRDERGATAVEASITLGILVLVLFGILEFGMVGKDWLTVSHASREAARAAATFGDDVTAQIETLDNVASNMGIAAIDNPGLRVRVFDPAGGASDTYSYNPGSTNCRAPGDCCRWSPCPDPYYIPANGLAGYVEPSYAPSGRDVTAPGTGRVGIEVFYVHNWIVNILGFSPIDMNVAVDYALEPRIFDP